MNHRQPVHVDHRARVTTFLALLSSERGREALSARMEPEYLAFELCRVWFDEIYVPGSSYLDGLKGDFSKTAAEYFRESFDDDELAAIERFHRFFELRVEILRKQVRAAGRIPDTDQWHSLMKDAGYLLEDLEPQAGELRRRLEEHFTEAGNGSDLDRLLAGVPR